MMDIQPIPDSERHNAMLAHSVPTMMPMPEVGAPRPNPLSMIWRRRGVLAIVLLACIAAALGKYWFSTKIYRSEARLFVQPAGSKAGLEVSSAGKLQTECERIRSASVLADVIGDPEIARLKTFESGQKFTLLRQNLQTSLGKENDIITVSFDSSHQRDAKAILQKVIDAYSQFHTKEKRAKVFELEQYRKRKQLELDKQQKILSDFREEHGALSFSGEKGNITLQQLSSLQEAYTSAHMETINAKSALDSAKAMLTDASRLRQFVEYLRSSGTISMTDSNESALRSQLMAMEQQQDELRRRYLPEHPAIRAGEATIASLRARIGDLERNLAQGHMIALEQKLAAARNREAELQTSLDKQMKSAMEFSKKADQYQKLESEVKRLMNVVERADMEIIQMTATETVGVPTIQIFDEPSEPSLPISPQPRPILFQGLLIGLILGCFAALVRDWTDQGLRTTDEIAQTMGVALLGTVPHIPGPPNPLGHGRKVDLEPASDVAEMYRTIRTAVFFGTPERESRTILVTSPTPGDGKSTFASNLAIAMAQTGKRVLLIDADFRRPVQHRVFECRPGAGLSTVLTGKDSLDQAIQHSGVASLDVLPCGPVPSNPAEILNSQSFAEVLEELSVRYEHVVLDSPPVMAVADARILAAMCSVTILVLRANHCTRKSAVHARKALQSVGAHILGVVVNDVPPSGERYSEYGSNYGGPRSNGAYAGAASDLSGSNRSSAIIPAKSFLDLRRK